MAGFKRGPGKPVKKSTNNDSKREPAIAKALPKEAVKIFLSAIIKVAEPVLERLGFELVTAKCPFEDGRQIVRMFIDHLPNQAEEVSSQGSSITLDDCANFSRALSDVLDSLEQLTANDPDQYVLEVSSPGLDRPLVKPQDFIRFAGRQVKVKLDLGDAKQAVKGVISSADGENISITDEQGNITHFTWPQVTGAKLVPQID